MRYTLRSAGPGPLVLIVLIFTGLFLRCNNDSEELTIWIGGGPQEIEFWEETVRAFNISHGSTLRLIRQPTYTDQRRQQLIASLSARHRNPDLFLMDVVWLPQFLRSGWLEPLDRYCTRDSIDTNIFFGPLLDRVDRWNGSLYALPVFMDAGLLYYRTDLLARHGLDPPATWSELIRQALLVQEAERKRDPAFNGFLWQGAQYEGLLCTFTEFIASHGGGYGEHDSVHVYTHRNVEALGFMRDLLYRYRISPLNTYTEMKEEEVRRSFQRGSALFERNWSYAWNLHQRSESFVRGKFSVASLPRFPGGEPVSALGGWHIGISSSSDKKREAWEFIRFVTSYAAQKKMTASIGWNPARTDVYRDSVLRGLLPHLPLLESTFLHAVPRPRVPYYSQLSEVLQRHVNACLGGSAGPDEALSAAQDEINELQKLYAD